ncbi:MAG: hypothetical protein AB2807_08245 [Candidatus Sedimenticola endophacoides]
MEDTEMAPQIEQITENRRFSVPLHPGQKIAARALALTSVLQTTKNLSASLISVPGV